MSPQATSPVTVQQAQTNALLSMLNLNTPVEPSASSTTSTTSVSAAPGKAASGLKVPAATGPPIWKILVLDQETKDILATVLRVQDLREIGVTLHVYAFPSFFLSSSPVTFFSFAHKKGNFTRLDHLCPTSPPSTSSLQPWPTSGELRKTSKRISWMSMPPPLPCPYGIENHLWTEIHY